jgi:hypothetical protein
MSLLMRFQVLMMTGVKMIAFWYVASCSLIEGDLLSARPRSTSTSLHDTLSLKAVIFKCHEVNFFNMTFMST